MLHNIPYLTRTEKTKVYGYRRRIPDNVRFLFDGKREIVKSLKTKSLMSAQVEVDRLNQWFSERIATAGYTKTSEPKLPVQLVRGIHEDMKRMGNHPSQLPKIDVNSDPREMGQFFNDVATAKSLKRDLDEDKITIDDYSAGLSALENGTVWKLSDAQAKRSALLNELRKKYRHPEKTRAESRDPNIDCDAEDYVLPQVKWDEADPEVIRYRIMCGESLLPPPTWQNAVDDYLRQYRSSPKQRSEQQTIKHTRAVISQCEKISAAFPYGMKTALTDIDAEDVRDFIRLDDTKPSTKAKNLTIIRAVWNSWSIYNQKQAVEGDPFRAELVQHKKAIDNTETHRRSFTPSEFAKFNESLSQETDEDVRLMGMLAAYCGAPTGEIAKLERRDVKLTSDTPYLVFRAISGKDRIARSVPLLEPIRTELEVYINEHCDRATGSVFTSKLSRSPSDLTKRLKLHITNERPDDPLRLVPYSLRHTFKDRAEAAMDSRYVQYILGHKTKDSSAVHQRYGTNTPPSALVKGMAAIQALTEWGMFEEFD